MKIRLLNFAILFAGYTVSAQIGINTTKPQATLDVVGSATNADKLDGIIAPRLTGDQLKAKNYTAAQTGTIVYVTAAGAAPSGQTAGVQSPGYYFFDGTKWNGLSTGWDKIGNAGTTATTSALGTDITQGNYLGTNDGQNLILATQSNVKGILDVNGTLQGGNSNTSSGPYASFTWGSNNVLSNSISSNVALGRNNTVSAQGANFPAVAIGIGNTATSGAKVIGNSNTVNGATNLVFGNLNQAPTGLGLTFGNSNTNNGGIAFGTGNTVSSNTIAVGSGNTASGTESMGLGFSATAGAGQIVYANAQHIFYSKGNGENTIVGINMVPTANTTSGAAIQIKGIKPADNNCTVNDEGAIRYNSNLRVHEGCNGSSWKAFTN